MIHTGRSSELNNYYCMQCFLKSIKKSRGKMRLPRMIKDIAMTTVSYRKGGGGGSLGGKYSTNNKQHWLHLIKINSETTVFSAPPGLTKGFTKVSGPQGLTKVSGSSIATVESTHTSILSDSSRDQLTF